MTGTIDIATAALRGNKRTKVTFQLFTNWDSCQTETNTF